MQNNIPTVHNSEIHCYIVKSNNLSTIFVARVQAQVKNSGPASKARYFVKRPFS